jgi:uncharacterized membrane protein YeiH
MLFALELIATIVLALTATQVAAAKKLDPFGFMFLAALTALGGGTIRDLLMGATPVFWLKQPIFVLIAAISGLVGYFLTHAVIRVTTLLQWLDAVSLALFSVLGTEIAQLHGMSPLSAIILGVITTSFGSILRDMVAGDVPLLLRKEVYVTVALFGATLYVLLKKYGFNVEIAAIITMICTFLLRAIVIWRKWSLPTHHQ